MDLEAILTVGLSKEQNRELNKWVGNSQERFDTLMGYLLHEEMRLCQRAAWVFGKVCQDRPELMLKWLPDLLDALKQPKHDAVIRNVIRGFQYVEAFPEEHEGQVFELCFNFLASHSSPIAVKAFSMRVCRNIAVNYTDLIPELILVIKETMVNGSAGIIARGRKEIKILEKYYKP